MTIDQKLALAEASIFIKIEAGTELGQALVDCIEERWIEQFTPESHSEFTSGPDPIRYAAYYGITDRGKHALAVQWNGIPLPVR